jgi:hypothetical protein
MMTGKQLRNRNVAVGENADPEGCDPQSAEPVTEHSAERIAVSVITDVRACVTRVKYKLPTLTDTAESQVTDSRTVSDSIVMRVKQLQNFMDSVMKNLDNLNWGIQSEVKEANAVRRHSTS